MSYANSGSGSPATERNCAETSGTAGQPQDDQPVLMADGGEGADEWTPQQDAPTYGEVTDIKARHYIDAVRAGFDTHTKAAEAMGESRSTASRNMSPLAKRDDSPLIRGKDGKTVTYRYDPDVVQDGSAGQGGNGSGNGQSGSGQGGTATGGIADQFPQPVSEYPGMMPDNRHNLEHGEAVPDDVPEYHPTGDEYEDLQMYARVLEGLEKEDMDGEEPFSIQMVGPTGCGKTHAPEKVAEERGWAYYEITLKDSIDPSDLEGYPNVLDALTTWVDGKLVEAVLSTRVRETVIVLDEVNRAPRQVRSVFMSLLDNRATIGLEARAGEAVEADKSNMLVVSTRNPNEGDYDVYRMDPAEKDRLGKPHTISYLGESHPGRETDLLTERKGVSEEWAGKAVGAANGVREAAGKNTQSGATGMGGGNQNQNGPEMADLVDRGVPTRTLLNMARDAYLNGQAGRPSPSMKAVRGYLENMYDGEALDLVTQVFEDALAGVDPAGGNGNGLLDNQGGA